jgi:type I site-specific restriction endonuclease
MNAGVDSSFRGQVQRRPQKRMEYLLRYTCDLMITVVEAKAKSKNPSDGLQQAKSRRGFQTEIRRIIYKNTFSSRSLRRSQSGIEAESRQ